MNCDRARRTLCDTARGLDGVLLKLHLLLCRSCRAEARRVCALDAALNDLPRFSPPPELLGRVLAQARTLTRNTKTRKGSRTMRRVAFALASLIVIGLLSAGLLMKPDRPDGRGLLITAAQAMEQVETIHMRGHGSKATPEGNKIDENSFEEWCSSEGSRMNIYDPQGDLKSAWVYNVGLGMAWYYDANMPWFPQGVLTVYHATPREVAALMDRQRERYVNPELEFAQEEEWGNAVTVREGERNWRTVTIVEVKVRNPSGETILTKEFEIDPETGRLVSSRAYGPDSFGKPLLGFRDVLEYGAPIPAGLFEFDAPPGAIEIEGRVNRYPFGIDLPNAYFVGYEIDPTDTWIASAFASSDSAEPRLAIDGDKTTRWTGRGKYHLQEPGMWFQLNFQTPVSASRMTVHHSEDRALGPFAPPSEPADGAPRTTGAGMSSGPQYTAGSNWPRGLQISISTDGRIWEEVPTGPAAADRAACALFGSPRRIVAVRLTLTEPSDEAPWSINEIRLYGPTD